MNIKLLSISIILSLSFFSCGSSNASEADIALPTIMCGMCETNIKDAQIAKQNIDSQDENNLYDSKSNESINENLNSFLPIIRHQVDILYIVALACAIRWQKIVENRKASNFLEFEKKRTGENTDEILERALIYAVTHKEELPEKGVLSVFPDIGTSRFIYEKEFPKEKDLIQPEYVLFIIDMKYYESDQLISFLKFRNKSMLSHIPVLLVIDSQKKIDEEIFSKIGSLIGVKSEDDNDVLPMPFMIDSLNDTNRVKYLIQGILNINENN